MANNVVSIPIWSVSGTTPVMALTGTYDLRVDPYSSTGISGTHVGGGIWNFTGLSDIAEYKLYNTATGVEVAGLTGGGTNTRVFFDGDLQAYVKLVDAQTIAGVKTFSSSPIVPTATTSTQATNFGQVINNSGNQTGIAGTKVVTGSWSYSPSTFTISGDGQFTSKKYVDDLFAGSTGVVQSTYQTKLMPTRTTEDRYSHSTMELCNTYLAGLITANPTYRALIEIESLGQASNATNVDDGTSAWVSAGVDIIGYNKPVLTRRGYNSSLTVDSRIQGVKIVDDTVVSARTYVNFTFTDCWFYVDTTEMTFTTCKFYNCVFRFDGGEAVTFSNCTGSGVTYNEDASVTFSGTQPANIISTSVNNIGF